MRIAIIEAGDTYTERRGTIAADLTGTQAEQIEQAAAIVAERGYRVMPNAEGGCCEYTSTGDSDYIAITVYPNSREETDMTTTQPRTLREAYEQGYSIVRYAWQRGHISRKGYDPLDQPVVRGRLGLYVPLMDASSTQYIRRAYLAR